MNWNAVAAIGQVVSALALVFVIVQIRHARSESRRAVSQGRAAGNREVNLHFSNEAMARIWSKAMIGLEVQPGPAIAALMEQAKLTREEAFSFTFMARALWSSIVQMIPNVPELPAIERREFEQTVRAHFRRNGPMRVVYESALRPNAHPDTVRYIESVLTQPA